MKTLCFLFAVAFLVFQVQANPTPTPGVVRYEEDDHGLPKDQGAESRFTTFACQGQDGYCLPHNWQCSSGYMFKDPFNDCPLHDIFKCCVLNPEQDS